MHGTNVEWFSTGGIRYRSGYVDGRKHGEEEEWDENGYLISSTWHLRGVKVSKKMVRALESGAMTAGMIASIKNAEVRRVCLEEFGYARFLAEVEHEIVDMDGDQELVRVSWHVREEDLWLVKVKCPSTGAFYTLRVPPGMKTVKQAVAWTFGGPENRYKPEAET
jgi:hypothetical protein